LDIVALIKQEMKRRKISNKELAIVAGTTSSTVSRFLNRKIENLRFEYLLPMIQYLFPKNELEIMQNYCKTLEGQNARLALDYASFNHLTDLETALIEKLRNSNNEKDVEWARIYEIYQRSRFHKLFGEDYVKELDLVNPSSDEAICLLYLMYMHAYLHISRDMVCEFGKRFERAFNRIVNPYLQKSFTLRYSAMQLMNSFYLGNEEELLFHSSNLLRLERRRFVLGTIYHTLGEFYNYIDFEKSEMNLRKALKIYEEIGHEDLQHTVKGSLTHLYNFWGKEPPYLYPDSEYLYDRLEYARYLINQSEIEKAKEILNFVGKKLLSEKYEDKYYVHADYLGIYYYYMGLAYDNIDYLYQSIAEYNRGNIRISTLAPALELLRRGERVSAVWAATYYRDLHFYNRFLDLKRNQVVVSNER
jgi:DNA-binding Xre family transcriptional regulator